MDGEDALKIFLLRVQVELLQGIVLRVFASIAPLLTSNPDPQAARRELSLALAQGIEKNAAQAESVYLSDSALAASPAEVRALYADEFREIAEKMKSSIDSYLG